MGPRLSPLPLARPAAAAAPATRPAGLLRLLTCGSVDDGKSTLIGRLLHDCRAVPEDQLAALARDSRRFGTQGDAPDLALLLDGLEAERAQGITIDVAHRYFATARRRFVIADAPGHAQYTRNMATAASRADLAVLLVDATRGLRSQTRRHALIAHLMGIGHLVLAVNKMDLVDFDRGRFAALASEMADYAARIGAPAPVAIPISALGGDNVVRPSPRMAWYAGPTLLAHLESVEAAVDEAVGRPFAMPVQWVCRPDSRFRGQAGMIASGRVRPGDRVRVLPSGRETAVARIVTPEGDRPEAVAGQSVMLVLADEVDCGRGDLLAAAADPPEVADQFEAMLLWLGEAPLLPGRGYLLMQGSAATVARLQPPRHRLAVETLEKLAARTLEANDIGLVQLATSEPLAFRPYAEDRTLGGFILVDQETNATVAAGMIRFALRRAHNIHWQALDVTREARAALKGQKPRVLWFTGLSGAGKSTIANLVEKKLVALGRHSFLLDGDNVRHGLCRDLGFSAADRIENIRRVGEVARLMADAGLIVLCAFISPFRAERAMVRALFPPGEFLEIFIDVPLAEAERRDPKGLYARARAGRISNFTGIDSPYEPPEAPDIRIDTTRTSPEEAAEQIVAAALSD